MIRAAVAATLAACALAVPARAQDPVPAVQPAAPGISLLGPVLEVSDIAGALAFYTDGLGLTLAMQMGAPNRREYMLRFSPDPAAAGLILIHDGTVARRVPITHPPGFDRLVLRVADIDALAARLDARKIAHTPIRDVAMGYRMMLVTDTEGYKLELVQSAPRR
jgi:catechol 2,3-dioxygenase-like lactoylglutathione lyase family enzyme